MRCVQELSKDHKRIARFRTRMEAVDKWMAKRSLPKGLCQRIAVYYQDVRALISCCSCVRSGGAKWSHVCAASAGRRLHAKGGAPSTMPHAALLPLRSFLPRASSRRLHTQCA